MSRLRSGAEAAPAGCALIDTALLRQTGALALEAGPAGVTITPTRAHPRLWDAAPMDPGGLAALQAALQPASRPGDG